MIYSSLPAVSLLIKKSSPSFAGAISYCHLASPVPRPNKLPRFGLNFTQVPDDTSLPKSKPSKLDSNRTHAVIYWVKDGRHQAVSLGTFQNVQSFNDIVAGEDYDVELVSKVFKDEENPCRVTR